MAREVSPATQAIRKMLDETKGNVTFSEAEPKLKQYEVNAQQFNNVKNQWKKAQAGGTASKGRTTKASSNGKAKKGGEANRDEAINFVQACGGLTAAKEKVANEQALVDLFEQEIGSLLS